MYHDQQTGLGYAAPMFPPGGGLFPQVGSSQDGAPIYGPPSMLPQAQQAKEAGAGWFGDLIDSIPGFVNQVIKIPQTADLIAERWNEYRTLAGGLINQGYDPTQARFEARDIVRVQNATAGGMDSKTLLLLGGILGAAVLLSK